MAEALHDRFVGALETALSGLSADEDATTGPALGPLITNAQQESVLARIKSAGNRALQPKGFVTPNTEGF